MTDEPRDPDEPLDGALAQARDAIASPPPPLDEATRRRLVTRALAESTPARPARAPGRWTPALAAAAVIALLALSGFALSALGHSSSSSKGSASGNAVSGTTSPSSLPSSPAALGEVSDPHQLLARVRAALRDRTRTLPTTSPPAAYADHCAAKVTTPTGVHAQPFAGATYRGAAAVVFVAHDKDRTLIYVLDRSTCRLLTSQFFHG